MGYVHMACARKGEELDKEKKVGGFCGNCGIQGTVYHVKGTADYYETLVNGILYKIAGGKGERSDQEVVDVETERFRKQRLQKRYDAYNERVPAWERIGTVEEYAAWEAAVEDAGKALEREKGESILDPLHPEVEEFTGEVGESITTGEETTSHDAEPWEGAEEPLIEAETVPEEKESEIARLERELEELKAKKAEE